MNSRSPDFKSGALTTRPRCLLFTYFAPVQTFLLALPSFINFTIVNPRVHRKMAACAPHLFFHWLKFHYNILFFDILLLCIFLSTAAHANLFQIICVHQVQVQRNKSSQNLCQIAIDLIKYKKSIFTVLYIKGLFYISSFLSLITARILLFSAGSVMVLSMFLSSSLNPVI